MAAVSSTTSIPPMTLEEEDQIILTRITNDERPLRRVIKKFQTYLSFVSSSSSSASTSTSEQNVASASAIDDASESFLVELASFQLLLKKSALICEAEARQVEEYQRERTRIDDEHGVLKGQIEQLKTGLEHAQMQRKRKIEYDNVAEKINTFPSREELELSIQSLENDMAAIRAEHDTQDRTVAGQQSALRSIVSDLSSLRFIGRDLDSAPSVITTPMQTPAPDGQALDGEEDANLRDSGAASVPPDTEMKEDGEAENEDRDGDEDREEGETGERDEDESSRFNSLARTSSTNQHDSGNDIEMGEVEEEPLDNKLKKKHREDLEEGEASDESSVLSDPPDSDV